MGGFSISMLKKVKLCDIINQFEIKGEENEADRK